MMRFLGTIMALLLVAGAAHATPGASTTPATKTRATSAPKSSASKAGAAKPSASKPGATTPAPGGPRKLEDIHIEGEIPVPQVLFITARDQRRFLDFHHRRYLRTSRELGEATTLPSRIVILPGTNPSSSEAPR